MGSVEIERRTNGHDAGRVDGLVASVIVFLDVPQIHRLGNTEGLIEVTQIGRQIAVVYHLHNLVDNIRIRFKIFFDINKPDVFTATRIFEAANWMERETYDFFGINFIGHPNLKRILNVDEMDYFPLRKEYPLEDATRTDKEDQYFGR